MSVSRADIEYWVPLVNAEYGLSDRDWFTIEYIDRLNPMIEAIQCEDYYVLYLIADNMWGDKELSVVSFYIKPEQRTAWLFLKLQNDIKSIAKQNNVRYINQGSHFNEKLFPVLDKKGYKISTMKMEV